MSDTISPIGVKIVQQAQGTYAVKGRVLLLVQRGILTAVNLLCMMILMTTHAFWQVPVQVFPVAMQHVVDQQYCPYQHYDTTAQ